MKNFLQAALKINLKYSGCKRYHPGLMTSFGARVCAAVNPEVELQC